MASEIAPAGLSAPVVASTVRRSIVTRSYAPVAITKPWMPGTSRTSAAGLPLMLAGSAPVTPANTAPSTEGVSPGAARAGASVAATSARVAHAVQGDRDTATEYFEKAIAAGPTQAKVFRDIALLYMEKGNVERASELLEEAAIFDPNDAETVLALAGLAEEQQDPLKTEQLLKRAIDLLPGNGRMLKMLGDFYRRDKKYDLASQLYEQAVATDPEDFQARVVLAILYMELGNDRGLDLLQTDAPRALANDEPFYSTYGALALEFGFWERALWSFQKAIDENKVEIRHKIGRARALLHLQRPDEAFGGLRAAIDALPPDIESRKQPTVALVSLLSEVGRSDEAATSMATLAAGMLTPSLSTRDVTRAGYVPALNFASSSRRSFTSVWCVRAGKRNVRAMR